MGYLPGYPYHLISDEEMFQAFIREDGFFSDFYPCPDDRMTDQYELLKSAIKECIDVHLQDGIDIPDWVYSYMLMSAVTFDSEEADIDYLAQLEGITYTNNVAEFNYELAEACYETSLAWIKKQFVNRNIKRPPTMFGEPHVIKSLRLDQANMLG